MQHAIRAEHQALSWLTEASSNGTSAGSSGLSGAHNLSYITASAAQMAASMSAQAAALKPILEVLGNRSASRAAQLDAKLSTPSTKALGLESAAAGEESAGANGRERLGAHEVSELEKAQRLVGQAERDQQAALAALTLARKADEHGSRLVASEGRSSQLKEVQEVLRDHPNARRVAANYTRDRAARMRTELAAADAQDDGEPGQPCTDMPCKETKAAAKAEADDDDPPTPCTDTNVGNCAKRGADDAEEEEPEEEEGEADEAEAAAFGEEEGDDDPTPCTDWGVPPCKEGEVPKGQAAPVGGEDGAEPNPNVGDDGAGRIEGEDYGSLHEDDPNPNPDPNVGEEEGDGSHHADGTLHTLTEAGRKGMCHKPGGWCVHDGATNVPSRSGGILTLSLTLTLTLTLTPTPTPTPTLTLTLTPTPTLTLTLTPTLTPALTLTLTRARGA